MLTAGFMITPVPTFAPNIRSKKTLKALAGSHLEVKNTRLVKYQSSITGVDAPDLYQLLLKLLRLVLGESMCAIKVQI